MPAKEISDALDRWSGYVTAKNALLEACVVRSFKSAEADFSEWLVAKLLHGSLPSSKSHPCYDVLAEGKRVQVKSICKAPSNSNGYIVSERDRSNDSVTGASHYAFVWFDELLPESVFLVAEDVVRFWPRSQMRRNDIETHPRVLKLWRASPLQSEPD